MKKKSFVSVLIVLVLLLIPMSSFAERLYVDNCRRTLLYTDANFLSKIVTVINRWQPVNGIGYKDGYIQVVTEYNEVGFIEAKYLSTTQHILDSTDKEMFYYILERKVKAKLKYPSLSQFPSMDDIFFDLKENGVVLMKGSVNSPNDFGMMLKNDFVVAMSATGENVYGYIENGIQKEIIQ